MYAIQFGIAVGSRFNEKLRRMWRGEREAVRTLQEKVDPDARYIWFHAASLGEFEQGRPLMEQIRRDCPQYRILLTFFSPSGYEVRKHYAGADIITYLPIDTVGNARKFLRAVRPVMAFSSSTSSGTTTSISCNTGAFPPTACRVSSVPTRSFSDGTDGATDVC